MVETSTEIWVQASLLSILVLMSGFFSGSETALTAMNPLRIKRLVERDRSRFERLKLWLDEQRQILAAILIGNNIVNIAATALATALCASTLEWYYAQPVPGEYVALVATLVMTPIIVVFGEITPKTLANSFAVNVAERVIRPLHLLRTVLAPLVFLSGALAAFLLRVTGGDKADRDRQSLTEEDVDDTVRVGVREGLFEVEEAAMIRAVFALDDRMVREVMVPRTDMTALAFDTALDEVLQTAVRTGHSRIPVYEDNIDDITGVLYVKDLLRLVPNLSDEAKLGEILRPAKFVPGAKRVNELLRQFRRDRIHQAMVLDEFGGIAGLVTLEDVLEEIVGEIADEYDRVWRDIREVTPGKEYVVTGKAHISDLGRRLGVDLEDLGQETIGGWLSAKLGQIPEIDQTVVQGEIRFEVTDASSKRVKLVRVIKNPQHAVVARSEQKREDG